MYCPGLPEDFSSKDFRPSAPLCFMEQLCELHDGLVLAFGKFYRRKRQRPSQRCEGLHHSIKSGGDLLSRALRRSTIGPGGLNDRVRNGIGWGTPGKATRSAKRISMLAPLSASKVKKTSLSEVEPCVCMGLTEERSSLSSY